MLVALTNEEIAPKSDAEFADFSEPVKAFLGLFTGATKGKK
jgi:hypothetical protein